MQFDERAEKAHEVAGIRTHRLGSAPSQCPQPQRRRPSEVRPRRALQRRLRHGRPRGLLLSPHAAVPAPTAADPAPPRSADAATAEFIFTAGTPHQRCLRFAAGLPPRFFLRLEGLDGGALPPRPPRGVFNATAVARNSRCRRGWQGTAAADVLLVMGRRLLSLASEEPHLRKKGMLEGR